MPDDSERPDEPTSRLAKAIKGLKLRSIGPALMGGRIADIAVDPRRPSTWYVAVGSGGVWKTTNAGTTWTPVFDDQPSASIGCVTLDPTRPDTVWVGTGESVSGRHVAWGSGVYRSRNGGATWDGMGLERSEHIGAILVDPRDGDTVYVAAEGPLWSSGGERGVFKSTDGGTTWTAVLAIDDDTGVTKLAFAPGDPDTLYAAAYQRRRHVATFLGGGPGSGIHKSTDGGTTWRRITEGLPKGDMGKIGLAVTAADPDRVYATIEAQEHDAADERGFYRSNDRGESWSKQNSYLSGGTGPHYYQEIFASPVDPDRVYQVDVFLHVTCDGGKTFGHLESGTTKHSDNHVVWIDPSDGEHLLVGTDAGLYETFDEGSTFRHFGNLPISQFYRIAVDNSLPFTNVLAGAQDLGTLYGPTRTTNIDGVRNQDWTVPLGADGYHTAFDPDDPDICYLEWQVGNVVRHNRRTGELIDIKPQPGPDDPPERWNWDCPIAISPHDPARLYVASQRVWRSDDRGDSWTPISGDLTTNRNRYEMPSFGAVPSIDSLYDHAAMSLYSTISHLSESPVVDGLLYVGTDDGLIHVSDDGGASWRTAGTPPGLPADLFVNAVRPSEHEADVVFVAADDHKHGDYTPYLFRSDDRGETWRSIRGDGSGALPDGVIVWAIEQDHRNPALLFVGAENGLWVTVDGGANWHRLSGGVPTVSFRDLTLQRRDDDLIGATFGRGVYVLDDYGPLRTMTEDLLSGGRSEGAAVLFPVRDAWWYVPRLTAQAVGQPTLGSSAFRADNPDLGATVTYHLPEDVVGPRKARRNKEETDRKAAGQAPVDVAVPDLDTLWNERVTAEPSVVVTIRNAGGEPVAMVAGGTKAGLHRVTWNLRRPPIHAVPWEKPEFKAPWDRDPEGPLVEPGRYCAEVAVLSTDGYVPLTDREWFVVKAVPELAESAEHRRSVAAFAERVASLGRAVLGAGHDVDTARDRIKHLRATIRRTPPTDPSLGARLESAHRTVEQLDRELNGDPVHERLSEADRPSIGELVGRTADFVWSTTEPPTRTQRTVIDRAEQAFGPWRERFDATLAELDALVADLDAAGGTWTRR